MELPVSGGDADCFDERIGMEDPITDAADYLVAD